MDRSQFDKWVFLVNALGIVYDPQTKMILIGRRENDPHLSALTRCFPWWSIAYEKEIEQYLRDEIKEKTWLDTNVETIIFAKTYPEKREFLSIYYLCTLRDGEVKAGSNFVEVKWIKPTEAAKYFTTSLHPNVVGYLKILE
jgi:hypothetical protein